MWLGLLRGIINNVMTYHCTRSSLRMEGHHIETHRPKLLAPSDQLSPSDLFLPPFLAVDNPVFHKEFSG